MALRKKDGQVDSAKAVTPGTALHRAVRAHANFAEYTPFAFVLLFLAELNGAPTKYVHAGYVALFTSRVAAGLGLNCAKPGNAMRVFGFVGTLAVMVGTGLYNVRCAYSRSSVSATSRSSRSSASSNHVVLRAIVAKTWSTTCWTPSAACARPARAASPSSCQR